MFKCITYIILFLFVFRLNSQNKSEQISEKFTLEKLIFLTGFYYDQANWQAIINLEKNIVEFDNEALFTRLGTAFYYQDQFLKAEKYLKKSYYYCPKNEFVQEILFYSVKFQGYDLDANQLKNHFSPTVLERIKKDFQVKLLESINLEAGLRKLQETEIGSDIKYFSLGSSWNLANAIKLNVMGNYLTQDFNGGKYIQPEIYVSLPISLGRSWHVTPSFHGAFTDFTTLINDFDSKGTANSIFLQLNISKRFGNFIISPNLGIHYNSLKQNYNLINFQTSSSSNVNQLGLSFYYTAKLSKKITWVINPNYYNLISSNENIGAKNGYAFSFYNDFYLNKWRASLSYTQKDAITFADREGYFYYNFSDKINQRISGSLGCDFNKNFGITITYQNENQTRTYDEQDINYNSFYLTLRYKF